jgi:hypothetical protein
MYFAPNLPHEEAVTLMSDDPKSGDGPKYRNVVILVLLAAATWAFILAAALWLTQLSF